MAGEIGHKRQTAWSEGTVSDFVVFFFFFFFLGILHGIQDLSSQFPDQGGIQPTPSAV